MSDGPALQFEQADFGGQARLVCGSCRRPLSGQYYELQGNVLCQECRDRMSATVRHGNGEGSFGRAVLYGIGGGVAGALVYWAIVRFRHIQLSLIAILVGYLVGRGIRIGAGGVGGRKYQILAVVLTYLSISASYALLIAEQVNRLPSFSSYIVLFGFAMIGPFLGGSSAILSVIIIGIGLWEAWKLTRGITLNFTGPFSVASAVTLDASNEAAPHP